MRLITLLALTVGAAIGLFLPDVDRTFPFLIHRSILTHSALIPLLGVLSVLQMSSEWKRAGVVGWRALSIDIVDPQRHRGRARGIDVKALQVDRKIKRARC